MSWAVWLLILYPSLEKARMIASTVLLPLAVSIRMLPMMSLSTKELSE